MRQYFVPSLSASLWLCILKFLTPQNRNQNLQGSHFLRRFQVFAISMYSSASKDISP